MWLTILGAAKTAVSAVAGILNALAKWAGYFFAYRLGRSRKAAEITEKTRDILDDQLKIASQPDLHRRELLAAWRLRKRGSRD